MEGCRGRKKKTRRLIEELYINLLLLEYLAGSMKQKCFRLTSFIEGKKSKSSGYNFILITRNFFFHIRRHRFYHGFLTLMCDNWISVGKKV